MTKDKIRGRRASTLQSASNKKRSKSSQSREELSFINKFTDCSLMKDKSHALKRLKTRTYFVDQGRVIVVTDKKDYTNKMASLVNDEKTYFTLEHDPTPAHQQRLNGKLLHLKKTETSDIQLFYRLRCCIPLSAKLYGLPKPNVPMRPTVLFCRSPTYQLSKCLTSILKPLTEES